MHQKAIIIVSDGFAYVDGVAKDTKQAEPEIEIEDDLDLIDRSDRQKYKVFCAV